MRFAMVAFGCVLLAAAAAAQVTPSPKQSLCVVSGQVVQDPGRTPLRRVVVSLLPAALGPHGKAKQYDVVTDAEGRFRIDGVQADNYVVSLDRNGFVETNHASRAYSST